MCLHTNHTDPQPAEKQDKDLATRILEWNAAGCPEQDQDTDLAELWNDVMNDCLNYGGNHD